MPEQPTAEQAEYNVAEAELFQLAVYGHHAHWPTSTGHPREYIAQVHAAQERYAAAVRVRALTEAADMTRLGAESLPDGHRAIPGLLVATSGLLAARTGQESRP